MVYSFFVAMKPFIYYEKIAGNTSEQIDFLWYLPHASLRGDFLPKIREVCKIDISHISDTDLYSYMYHEADTGILQIMEQYTHLIKNFPYNIAILVADVPRAFCDMNRPIEKAIPEIIRSDFLENIYHTTINETEKIFKKSEYVFQLHSMNSFDMVGEWNFENILRENRVSEFLETAYSGKNRECTLLTENDNFEQRTFSPGDEIMEEIFQKNTIKLEKNTAYRLNA